VDHPIDARVDAGSSDDSLGPAEIDAHEVDAQQLVGREVDTEVGTGAAEPGSDGTALADGALDRGAGTPTSDSPQGDDEPDTEPIDPHEIDAATVDEARNALLQRLAAAYEVLARDGAEGGILPVEGPAGVTEYLDAMIHGLVTTHRSDQAWLIFVALSTVLPEMADVEAIVRHARLNSVVDTRLWLMGFTLRAARSRGRLTQRMTVLTEAVVVDVNFSATDEHNSGIQRVVRRTMPEWVRQHETVTLCAWGVGAMRTLTEREEHRVIAWDSERAGAHDPSTTELLIPWKSRVVLAEVPSRAYMCDPIAAMARYSGNVVSLIGYDAIPLVSAETVPVDMSDHFAKFLSVVKWADSVAAISVAAAGEFRGFARMVGSQGLSGPRVVECSLPADPVRSVVVGERTRPLVVVVGSKEPRKNHVAVLFAAERLWREGLDFELFFVGAYGWDTRLFRTWLRRLQKAGRAVSAPARVGDDGLWRAYAEARFTVFPSLHEGYGLPVAESLAYGTPVITTVYGSTGEIAAGGGCLTVDPRDDEQIVDAMRVLLTDDAVLARLKVEAAARPVKTWEQYAAEVWAVVGGSV